jgi:hypothetical protein
MHEVVLFRMLRTGPKYAGAPFLLVDGTVRSYSQHEPAIGLRVLRRLRVDGEE